jgi:hypothetical protein
MGVELMDTPGILYPKIETEEVGLNLASLTSINEDILDKEEIASYIITYLYHNYKDILLNRLQNPYDITSNTATTPMETFKYLLAMVSVDGFTLDLAYKQALESFRPSESGVNPIPNDEQELSTKFVAAYLSNPEF